MILNISAALSRFVRSLSRLFLAIGLVSALVACSGGGGGSSTPTTSSNPPVVQPDPSFTVITSEAEAHRFLNWATFGPLPGQTADLVGTDAATWLQQQFRITATPYLDVLVEQESRGEEVSVNAPSDLFWEAVFLADDQVRQRMIFALSQIVVVSDVGVDNKPFRMGYYVQLLSDNALGNYGDLIRDITYSPAMAEYLTYLQNRKENPDTGSMPDENYARELMQLFTIGLVELNIDGTPIIQVGGEIESYTNEDVMGLSRVFTGLSFQGDDFFSVVGRAADADYQPLKVFPEEHSIHEKSFLGLTIPAGTDADTSIGLALGHLLAHDNVAPFISRQLIQRFTMSHPPAPYVSRVAQAYEAGRYTSDSGVTFGDGRRGNLQATLAAILLDEVIWVPIDEAPVTHGKIREPILLVAAWGRAFNVTGIMPANEFVMANSSDSIRSLGQHPFRSPSVFNFYRPGYIAPGTQTGALDMTAPEFQTINGISFNGIDNVLQRYAVEKSAQRDSSLGTFAPDYSDEVLLAEQPEALAQLVSIKLTGGRISAENLARIAEAVEEMPISGAVREEDLLDRARIAVMLAVTTPAFAVIY